MEVGLDFTIKSELRIPLRSIIYIVLISSDQPFASTEYLNPKYHFYQKLLTSFIFINAIERKAGRVNKLKKFFIDELDHGTTSTGMNKERVQISVN